MNISPKERFLDICHFKRLGDLCMLSVLGWFPKQTLEKWVKQGALEEIINDGFARDYFQIQHFGNFKRDLMLVLTVKNFTG